MDSKEHVRFQITNSFMVSLKCLETILDYLLAASPSRYCKCGLKRVRVCTSMTIFEWCNFEVRKELIEIQKQRCPSVPKSAFGSIKAQTQYRCDWNSEIVLLLPKCRQDIEFEHLRREGSEPYTTASSVIYDHFTGNLISASFLLYFAYIRYSLCLVRF